VGALSIANIMLVGVMERTPEIGGAGRSAPTARTSQAFLFFIGGRWASLRVIGPASACCLVGVSWYQVWPVLDPLAASRAAHRRVIGCCPAGIPLRAAPLDPWRRCYIESSPLRDAVSPHPPGILPVRPKFGGLSMFLRRTARQCAMGTLSPGCFR